MVPRFFGPAPCQGPTGLRPLRAVALALLLAAPAMAHHAPGHGDGTTGTSSGAWTVVGEASRLTVVSVKNNAVAEVHRFTGISGSVGADGSAQLRIALDSVDSGIPVRDQRLRELLFDTAKFPEAHARLRLDPAPVRELAVGASLELSAPVALELRGVPREVAATLRITRLANDHWLVVTEQPVVVDAVAFGLNDGIAALREVAGLHDIATALPVSLVLVLDGD